MNTDKRYAKKQVRNFILATAFNVDAHTHKFNLIFYILMLQNTIIFPLKKLVICIFLFILSVGNSMQWR